MHNGTKKEYCFALESTRYGTNSLSSVNHIRRNTVVHCSTSFSQHRTGNISLHRSYENQRELILHIIVGFLATIEGVQAHTERERVPAIGAFCDTLKHVRISN